MNSRINLSIPYPDIDINDTEAMNEYLNEVSKQLAHQIYKLIKENEDKKAIKEQNNFIKQFLYNPDFIEKVINGR